MDLHLIPRAVPTDGERSAIDASVGPAPRRDLLLPALHAAQATSGWITPGALNHICRRLDVPPADAYGVATFYSMFSTAPGGGVRVSEDVVGSSSGSAVHAGRLLRRLGRNVPDDYPALRCAIEMGPEAVIREVTASGLVGRGGAAFPAGRKWEAVARAEERPHYLVCNADESEPGTFKDRVLLEGDPHSIVEAMAIAALATGCERAFLYVRGEYALAAERMARALQEARGIPGFRLDVELRRGAGAYICGEETALFNSIEGRRGEPRSKPPYPAQRGLFGKPTLVHNVETLANVPHIVLEGAAAFAASETRLFCLSGCVERPGVYEVPVGTTLRTLIEMAGGVRDGRPLRAALVGGAAGSFLTPDEIDAPPSSGPGAVILFDDRVDLVDVVLRIAAFFREESCGQCVPCREGTRRQEEALRGMAAGSDESALLADIAQSMRDASICGLGQTASLAVQSAIRKLGVFGRSR